METKICTRCKIEKDVSEYYIRKDRNNQVKAMCKNCENKRFAKPIPIVPNLEGELWRDIDGFEKIYVVSNMGRVKRIMHRKHPTNIIMNTSLNGGDYHYLSLTKSGKNYPRILSRLVAIAFIPNPENKPQVNHIGLDKNGIPGNKNDNRAISLEWSTSKENINHAWKNGLYKPLNGIKNGNAILKDEDVINIRASKLSPTEISKMYNVNLAAIYKILSRQRWKHI